MQDTLFLAVVRPPLRLFHQRNQIKPETTQQGRNFTVSRRGGGVRVSGVIN